MLVLGAQPNFIGWVLGEGQQHPTTSQGVRAGLVQILHDGVGGKPEGNGRS